MKWGDEDRHALLARELTSSSQNMSRAIGSTPEVGSSRISSLGPCTTATASERRCRIQRQAIARIKIGCETEALHQGYRCGRRCRQAGKWKSPGVQLGFCATVGSPYSEKACDI